MSVPVIRTKIPPELDVPEVFSRLRDIVYNLWWSWSPSAHLLFNRLAPATWQHYRNPIDVLIDLGPQSWQALENDDDLARSYHQLVEEFEAYMWPAEPTWFARHHADYRGGPFAYFSTEFGWHECLQVYSGGLGVLAGDHCKAASDLGIPLLGVGLMYKHGYFFQTIDADGHQQHIYPDYDLNRLPLLPVVDATGRELHVPVDVRGRSVYVRAWKASVGRVQVLLLDTDLPINHPADRPITAMLYVGGREMRLCQEIVLGMGGVRVLERLGIRPAVWHMNEGHSALLSLQRLGNVLDGGEIEPEQARELIARDSIFTTHTPVPAGNELFDRELVRDYLGQWCTDHGIAADAMLDLGRHPQSEGFNLTALAIRCSWRTNGVSELHGRVADAMWRPLLEIAGRKPIEHVTNGVHVPTWIGPEVAALLRKHLGADFDQHVLDPGFADAVNAIPDYELWAAHAAQKMRLVGLTRQRAMQQFARHGRSPEQLRKVESMLDPEILTLGFARRFATYKRADLILRDPERFKLLLAHADRPVQIVFAGKAHPADRPGQDLIRRIFQAGLSPELEGRLAFLESYDMRLGRGLVQGVDVWLNNPRRPMEASGTSGMKAAVNGVLNCSILDGWWCEGHDAAHGWAIGTGEDPGDEAAADRADANALYATLENEVVPCYYERNENGLPTAWIRRMKRAIGSLTPRFSSSRMVQEYTERYYLEAARGWVDGTPALPSGEPASGA